MGKDVDIKCLEIRKLVKEKKYDKALEIIETIDIIYVKNFMDYKTFYEVYYCLKRYDDAKEMLVRMYKRNTSKRVLYKLVCLAVRSGKLDEAEASYEDYIQMNPEGEERYILKYLIDSAKHEDYGKRIHSLELLKEYNYYEEWAYELAKLYHKAGRKEDCIHECQDIILWFGKGIFVEKAKMLKRYYEEGDISFLDTSFVLKAKDEEKNNTQAVVAGTADLADQVKYIKNMEQEMNLKYQLKKELSATVDLNKAIADEKKQIKFDFKTEMNVMKGKVDNIDKETWNVKIGECINQMSMVSENFYIYIADDHYENNLDFIKKLAKAVQEAGIIRKSQVAKIKGENLNHIKLEQRVEKLRNSILLIENASALYFPTVQQLMELMSQLKGELVIIFEDTKENIKIFREEHYELNNSNSYRINL